MTTVEFLREVKSILKPGGAAAANLWSSDRKRFLAMLKTYESVFKKAYRFPAALGNNTIIVATDTEIAHYEITARAVEIQNRFKFPYDFVKCASRYDTNLIDSSGAKLITDAEAPADWRESRKL